MVLFPSEFSSPAAHDIKKLEKVMQTRIKSKITELENDPSPKQVGRVESYQDEKVFRIRVGDYRILYLVRYTPNQLIVVKVDKRSRVYE